MRKNFASVVFIAVLLFVFSAGAFANDHCTLKVTGVNFSQDGNSVLIFTQLINDGDVDLTITSVTFDSLSIWDNGGSAGNLDMKAQNVVFDNLNLFVKEGHYIEYTFSLNAKGSTRRHFIGRPGYNYRYSLRWNYMPNTDNNADEYDDDEYEDDYDDYDEDEEDDSF